MNAFLDGLKRDQGDQVSLEVIALVANSMEMTEISVGRMDRMREDDVVRSEYGLGSNQRSIYRTIEHIGRNSDDIVRFLSRASVRLRFRTKTAESISEELGSFSLTAVRRNGSEKGRIWSNFTPIIRALKGRKLSVPVPKAPGQASIDVFG